MHALPWTQTPREVIARWPREIPLAALVTGTPDARWGRWSMLAAPSRVREAFTADGAMEHLREAFAAGTWVVSLAYELGAAFEPTAIPSGRMPDDGWPLTMAAECADHLIHDHATGTWSASPSAGWLVEALEAGMREDPGEVDCARMDEPRSEMDADAYRAIVADAVERIHAGELFQANLARRFRARWSGEPRAILGAALDAARPRHGAWLETPERALLSMSPELFLDLDRPSGRVVSRPIKGTRPAEADDRDLLDSTKDAAELHMIVDLMRNDLGRCCRPGSVRVTEPRTLERHETVLHAVAEVAGTLDGRADALDLVRACFPPGSVTGAPKVRAMQVIDRLEPVARGPYCGAVGLVTPERMSLNVAIRTALLRRDGLDAAEGTLTYHAGCGIVSDSDPAEEEAESRQKAEVLRRTAAIVNATAGPRGCAASAPPAPPPSSGAQD